jgi:hypothetical protein
MRLVVRASLASVVLLASVAFAHSNGTECRTGACCNAITDKLKRAECNSCISKGTGCGSPPTKAPFVCRHYHQEHGPGKRCLIDNGRD